MPCYHFTYHGHATWMPDRPQGYVHRQRGLQPSDPQMAHRYRQQQKEPAVAFDETHFNLMRDAAIGTQAHIDVVIHGVAADVTHFHVATSWAHERTFKSIRTGIRSAMSRTLNQQFGKRTWFSDSPSRKQVKDHQHFDWLILEYFPDHRWCWVRPEDRDAALRRQQHK